jgi:hypothetical protein
MHCEIVPVSGGYRDRKVREGAEHENTPRMGGCRARRVWEGTKPETMPVSSGYRDRSTKIRPYWTVIVLVALSPVNFSIHMHSVGQKK